MTLPGSNRACKFFASAALALCLVFMTGTAVRAQKDSLTMYLTRGGGALQSGNYQFARESYEAALRIDSLNVSALKAMGTIASAVGYQNRAVAFYKKALATGVEDEHLLHNLAITYEVLKQYDSSFAYYAQSLSLAPENFEFVRNYGSALMKASRFSNAIVVLQKALSIDPTNGEIHYMTGNCYAALPDPKSAIKSYEQAMEFGYDTGKLRYHLGSNYVAVGEKLLAEEHLGFAVGKSPDSLQFRQTLAAFYLEAGVADQARNFFRENLNRDSTFLNSRIGLGVAFALLGQMDSAYIELANVKRVSPEGGQAMSEMIDRAVATLRLIDSLNNAATPVTPGTRGPDGK
jgi:tetratricopeptide (TPR) repeat protein